MKTTVQLFGFALLITLQHLAAGAPPVWREEPKTVFGLELGAVLGEPGAPRCPPRSTGRIQDPPAPTSGCYTFESDPAMGGVSLNGLPALGFYMEGFAGVKEGRLTNVTITMSQSDFDVMADALVKRFGAPHSRKVKTLQNSYGASFSSTEMQWSGRQVSITASERYPTVDRSVVVFSSAAGEAASMRERSKKSDAAAQKF